MNMLKTKRTLVISVISLMLCVAMLVGTTYAWFTDSVTSGTNKIVAGNLDIEVQYSKDGSNFADLASADSVFTKTALWEPGYTEYVTLRIQNKGTLAFDYTVNVSPVSESGGINVNGASYKLSDYLMFGTTVAATTPTTYTGDTARADARAAVTATAKGLTQTTLTQSGSIEAKAADQYINLVVYMPTDVGNEANYKTGTTPPQIELGITVIAKQRSSESDSFNNQYDASAQYDGTLTSVVYNYFPQTRKTAQLMKSNSGTAIKDGDDVNVTADVNTNTITVDSEQDAKTDTPYASVTFSNTKVNFDGNGKATVTLIAEKKSEGNITLSSGDDGEEVVYDVKVSATEGFVDGTIYTVKLFIGEGKQNVTLKHGDDDMTDKTNDGGLDGTTADTFVYNSSDGYITMQVSHFSDFTAQYDAPVAAVGTKAFYSANDALEAAAADKNTVVLIRDVKNESIVIDSNNSAATLDTNGKAINNLAVNASYTLDLKGSEVTTLSVASEVSLNLDVNGGTVTSANVEGNLVADNSSDTGSIETITMGSDATLKADETVVDKEDIDGDGKDNVAYTSDEETTGEPTEEEFENSPYVAKSSDDTSYTTIKAAFKLAATGSTVTLTKDTSFDSTLELVDKELTLDLNGKTLTSTGNDHDGICLSKGSDLTVKNGTYDFQTNSDSYDAFFLTNSKEKEAAQDATTLELQKDVTINMTNGNSAVHACGDGGGKVIATVDATINVQRPNNAGQFAAIQALYNATLNVTENAKLTINASFDSYSERYNDTIAIMAWGRYNVVNVSGGTFNITGTRAFVQAMQIGNYNSANPTQFNVTGGTFNLSNTDGTAYAFTAYYSNGGAYTVSDCTINGTLNALALCNYGKVDLRISGGKYSAEPKDYLTSGCESVYDEETGMYGIEINESAQVLNALTNGGTATITKEATIGSVDDDINHEVQLANPGTVNLVLNNTLKSGTISGYTWGLMRVLPGTKLNISANDSGKFVNTESNSIVNVCGGELTVNSGKFESDGYCFWGYTDDDHVETNTLTINEGTFTSKWAMFCAGYTSVLTINGGTFNSTEDGYILEDYWNSGYAMMVGTYYINGGTFLKPLVSLTGYNGNALSDTTKATVEGLLEEKLTITGGTFYDWDPTAYVNTDSYIVTTTTDGSSTVYTVAAK